MLQSAVAVTSHRHPEEHRFGARGAFISRTRRREAISDNGPRGFNFDASLLSLSTPPCHRCCCHYSSSSSNGQNPRHGTTKSPTRECFDDRPPASSSLSSAPPRRRRCCHRSTSSSNRRNPWHGTTKLPTRECFDNCPAGLCERRTARRQPEDIDRPERAYVAPKERELFPLESIQKRSGSATPWRFCTGFKLPEDVTGESVLVRWHYVTSSGSCVREGYGEYDWPKRWTSSSDRRGVSGRDAKANDAGDAGPLPRCALSEDGDGECAIFIQLEERRVLLKPCVLNGRDWSRRGVMGGAADSCLRRGFPPQKLK